MVESIQQLQSPDEMLMEELSQRPDLKELIKGYDVGALAKVNAVFQTAMHNTLLGIGTAEKEETENVVAMCRGAAALVAWVQSMKFQLFEYERSRVREVEDGANDNDVL